MIEQLGENAKTVTWMCSYKIQLFHSKLTLFVETGEGILNDMFLISTL